MVVQWLYTTHVIPHSYAKSSNEQNGFRDNCAQCLDRFVAVDAVWCDSAANRLINASKSRSAAGFRRSRLERRTCGQRRKTGVCGVFGVSSANADATGAPALIAESSVNVGELSSPTSCTSLCYANFGVTVV